MRESGGNPRAINLWDINAKRGTPSKGLFQTIDPTFNRYKLPGMDDIWNPVHNAVAAIRYIIARYGTVFNVPGIRNLMRGKGYVGYAKGTNYHPGGWAMVGEEGEELAYIPRQGLALVGVGGPTLMRLPAGTSVLPHDETKKFLSLWIPGYAKGVGEFPIEFRSNRTTRTKETPPVINITLNYQGRGSEEDAYRMLDIIERDLGNRINTRLRMSGVKV